MQRHLLLGCAVLLAGALFISPALSEDHAPAKSAAPAPADVSPGTDLDIDPGFGGNGTGQAIYDFNSADGNHDEGLRTFYRCAAFSGSTCTQPDYYAVGRRHHGSAWDIIVAKADMAGNPQWNFGVQGRLTLATSFTDIRDAAFDPVAGRIYVAGAAYAGMFSREAFAVTCIDVATGTTCSQWGLAVFYFFQSLDSNIDSIATRIAFDPAGFLYAGGIARVNGGFQLAVRKMNAANGTGVTSFGNTGSVTYALHSPLFPTPAGQDATVLDMALSASTSPQGPQLYLVGSNKLPAGNSHGYVVWLDPQTGAYLKSRETFGAATTGYAGAISAISVLADGDLALAGYLNDGPPDEASLVLARVRAADSSLDLDTSFCGSGACVHDTGASPHGWQNTLPSAIAERPGNRDLVVAMQAGVWSYNFSTNLWRLNQKQVVEQYDAGGSTLRASRLLDFPAASDTTPTAYSAGLLVDKASVLVTGTRLWGISTDDFDVTLVRLVAHDSIFADRFGGPAGD